jgi:lipopolysaccharide export system permease protein
VNLLNRYILTAFARIFGLALAAFAGIYLLVDFFERVDNFIEHKAQLSQYILYFTNKIPMIVVQVAPMAVLMGVFMCLGGLSRNSELTAMRASGISLWRITIPLLATALLLTGTLQVANEFVVPLSAQKVNYILNTQVKGKPQLSLKLDRLWFREGNAIVNVRQALPEKNVLQGVTIYKIGEDFRLQSRTDTPKATYVKGEWLFENTTVRQFPADAALVAAVEHFGRKPVELAKTPDDFRIAERKTEELGVRDLHKMATKLAEEGYDATRYRVDMHARLATPFASVIMAFLGIPFALQKKRGASLATGITISVAIGISYHIIQAMLLAFGYSAVIPPVVAAWAPNLLFGLFGIWLLLMVRE